MTGDEELLAQAKPSIEIETRPSAAFEPSKDWPMSPTLQRKERILPTDVFNNLSGSGGAGSSGTGVVGLVDTIIAVDGYPTAFQAYGILGGRL